MRLFRTQFVVPDENRNKKATAGQLLLLELMERPLTANSLRRILRYGFVVAALK